MSAPNSEQTENELPEKLEDCARHGMGAGSELIIVEGDSAASAVSPLRAAEWQAVLPVQGKPMNASRASERQIAGNAQFQDIFAALGAGSGETFDLASIRYDRVIIVCDGDADGIHARVLLTLMFDRCLTPYVADGRLYGARPPQYGVTAADHDKVFVVTESQRDATVAELRQNGFGNVGFERYRSIASMTPEDLHATCLAPETRVLNRLTREYAASAIEVIDNFGPKAVEDVSTTTSKLQTAPKEF